MTERGRPALSLYRAALEQGGPSASRTVKPKAAKRLQPAGVAAGHAKRDSGDTAPAAERPEPKKAEPRPEGAAPPKRSDESAAEPTVESPVTPVFEQAKENARKVEEKVPPLPREPALPEPPKVKIP